MIPRKNSKFSILKLLILYSQFLRQCNLSVPNILTKVIHLLYIIMKQPEEIRISTFIQPYLFYKQLRQYEVLTNAYF